MLKFNFTFCLIFSFLSLGAQQTSLQWARQIQGPADAIGNAITVDANGNTYAAGTFTGTADFDPSTTSTYNLSSKGLKDLYVTKLDAAGVFQWVIQIGSTGNDEATSIALDSNGYFYITGYFSGTADFDPSSTSSFLLSPQKGADIFVARFNASGQFGWARQIGGDNADAGTAITVDENGYSVTCGYFHDSVDFNPDNSTVKMIAAYKNDSISTDDLFVLKLDSAGQFIWARGMGGGMNDEANSLCMDKDGNVYITGSYQDTVDFNPGGTPTIRPSKGLTDIFILKLDIDGNTIGAKTCGGFYGDGGLSIACDLDGITYTTGYFFDFADFDPGNAQYLLGAASNRDIFILKLDSEGKFQWAKQMGGSADDAGFSIAIDEEHNIYSTGIYWGSADFNPTQGTGSNFTLKSHGKYDIFLSKLDKEGDFVWAHSIGGTATDIGTSVTTGQNMNVYATGYFYSSADLDPGSDTLKYIASAYDAYMLSLYQCPVIDTDVKYHQDTLWSLQNNATYQWLNCATGQPVAGATGKVFIAKANGRYAVKISYGNCTATSDCITIGSASISAVGNKASGMSLYPNPAANSAELHIASPLQEYTIHIINSMGLVMQTIHTSETTLQINLHGLASGIYTIVALGMSEKVMLVKL